MIEVITFYFEEANLYMKWGEIVRQRYSLRDGSTQPPNYWRYTNMQKNGMAFEQEDVLKSD